MVIVYIIYYVKVHSNIFNNLYQCSVLFIEHLKFLKQLYTYHSSNLPAHMLKMSTSTCKQYGLLSKIKTISVNILPNTLTYFPRVANNVLAKRVTHSDTGCLKY